MSAGYTPGPWRIGMMGGEKQTHVVDMGNPPSAPFAAIYPRTSFNAPYAVVHSDGPREEVEANARLIAAAPALYEALDRLCRAADELDRHGLPDEFEQADAALSLARGEQA